MGTDSAKLFNKALADQILAMQSGQLTSFLEENIGVLQRKPSNLSLVLFEMERNGGSASSAVERLLSGEQTLTELRADIAQDFAFGDEEILLDYWGCYAHVFDGHPEGAITSCDYLPEQEEEIFLLLRPEHVDQMIQSLHAHEDDLSVMGKGDIERLEGWRDFCASDTSYMVAYLFDY
jgi:hypothetical protein